MNFINHIWLYVLILVLALDSQAQQFESEGFNLCLTGRYIDSSAIVRNNEYNDVWGYVDSNGREYAIFGGSNFTYFVDLINPKKPRLVSKFSGTSNNAIWRDFKTYKNYAYGVTDNAPGALQIFDLKYLPDSVVKVYESDSLISTSHNIFIENGRLYTAGAKDSSGSSISLGILDIETNPAEPTFLAKLSLSAPSYIHDMFVVNDTIYASGGNAGFFVLDAVNPQNISLITDVTAYPGKGYNHSAWMSADSKYLVFVDEVPRGLPIKIYDASNKESLEYIGSFISNEGATVHNPFIIENFVVASYYEDGVQIFDISDPANVQKFAFFDTYPDNGNGYFGYNGCWGVYPFLPSGLILASDRKYGLFVLSFDKTGSTLFCDDLKNKPIAIYPNPVKDEFYVSIAGNLPLPVKVEVYDLRGVKKIEGFAPGDARIQIDTRNLASGMYIVRVSTRDGVRSSKFFKVD